jgi:hypothetical protein
MRRRAIHRKCRAALALAVVAAVIGSSTAAMGAVQGQATPVKKLKSFSATVSVGVVDPATGEEVFGLVTESVFVRPANQDCKVTANVGGISFEMRYVVKGGKTFVDAGDGLRAAGRAGTPPSYSTLCASNRSFWSSFDFPSSVLVDGQPDTVNGLAAETYDLSQLTNEFPTSLLGLPPGLTIEEFQVSIAEKAGVLLAFDIAFSSETAEACGAIGGGEELGSLVPVPCSITADLELSRVNDSKLKVKAPKQQEQSRDGGRQRN